MTVGGFDGVERRGLMFVLSSPSGAGKTTLSRLLVAETPALQMSVSATTRPMRPPISTCLDTWALKSSSSSMPWPWSPPPSPGVVSALL